MATMEIIFVSLIEVILSKELYFTVQEELPTGSLLGDLRNFVNIESSNHPRISNLDPLVDELFFMDSWFLKVKKRIDREDVCSQLSKNLDCILKLIVIYGDIQKPIFLTVFITISDVNDNAPKFTESEIEHTVVENANPGLSDLFLYQAEDPDRLDNGSIKYQLQQEKDSSQSPKFRLQLTPDNVPKLIQLAALDYEIQHLYVMELLAFDGGYPAKTGTMKIQIKVKDENDNAPIFQKNKYEETIYEDITINSKIIEVQAIDADFEENGRVTYQAAMSSTVQQKLSNVYFGIRSYQGKGIVYPKMVIDIDVTPRINSFEFHILACDSGHPQLCSRSTVVIRVVDINDYRPTIMVSYLSTNGKNTAASAIPENSINNYIAIVTVSDRDSDSGGLVECQLSHPKFELIPGMNDRSSRDMYKSKERLSDQSIYHIRNIKEFDREEVDVVRFRISCKDNPNLQKTPFVATQLSSEVDITVYIEDLNDNAPQFLRSRYEFRILENRPINNEKRQFLGNIEARDKDVNSKFTYKLLQNPLQAFDLEDNGELFLRRAFDREEIEFNPIKVQVMVADGHFNTSTIVLVHILDDNDLAPVFLNEIYRFNCVENEFSTFVGVVEANDGDSLEFGQIEYKIFPPSPLFSVNSKSGMIRVTSRLDREERDGYTFIVIAIDNARERGNRNTGTATVSITVLDLNDNYPKILFPQPQKVILIDPSWAVGHKIFALNAVDPDMQENGTLTYKIVKDGLGIFNIDSKSGDIFLSRKLSMSDNQIVSSHLVLMASDNGQPVPKSMAVSVSIKIAFDSQSETPDFGADYSQANAPQIDRTNRKTLIIIIIVALVLIVTVIMTILIVIYQSRIPTQSQISRKNKQKQAEFQEIHSRNQSYPSLDVTQHFMTSDENFVVPVTNRCFQNSISLMRQEDSKDITVDKLNESGLIDEYQQLMTTPTLMRIWHNNLNPYTDIIPVDKGSQQEKPPSCTNSSGIMSNDSVNDINNKSQSKEPCSSSNYLQSSFV